MSFDLRLGFLASHGGTNMSAMLEAIDHGVLDAKPMLLISNNPNSKAMQTAAARGLPAYAINEKTHGDSDAVDAAICATLQQHNVNLVILNGYMKKIGARTLSVFDGRILNIHPSLLPKYGGQGMYGQHVHAAVLAANERNTGVTVHVIDEVYDQGRILGQAEVSVLPDDTVETLAARVLGCEKSLYVDVLQRIATGAIRL